MSLLPTARVSFTLGGGWRISLAALIAYFGLAAVLSGVVYSNATPADYSAISGVFLMLVTLLQGAFVLLVATTAIRTAVLRDFDTGMLESHRLTPLSSRNLVLGYLVGPPLQALVLFGGGLVLGGFYAANYTPPFGFSAPDAGDWYYGQGCLLMVGLLVASLVLLTALSTAGKTNLIVMLLIVAVIGGWLVVPLVPGMALATGVLSTLNFLGSFAGYPNMIGSSATMPWTLSIQFLLIVILLLAACRKVRAPHAPAFSVPLGIALLLVWGVALVVGWQMIQSVSWFADRDTPVLAQWVASVGFFLLIALVSLAGVAGVRHQETRVHFLLHGKLPPILRPIDGVVLLVAGLALALMGSILPSALPRTAAVLSVPAAAIVLSLWTDYVIIGLALSRGMGLFRVLLFSWLVLKGLPLLADGAAALANAAMTGGEPHMVWWLSAFSPLGSLFMQTLNPSAVGPGMAFQVCVAVVLTVIWRKTSARAYAPRTYTLPGDFDAPPAVD